MTVQVRDGLMAELRARTADQHQALERAVDILSLVGEPARLRVLLERFYGFHAVWEPAIASSPIAAFATDRGRLAHLSADLLRLGAQTADLAALPRCRPAAALAATSARAIGSLYVMEGSTLGGQVISRTLREGGASPPQGLAYFNPYGRETGARWRAFAAWAEAAGADEDRGEIIASAAATFTLLRTWLTARA
jgi:heme oxygenase (biliverdin-IX-beta and delta-forming)